MTHLLGHPLAMARKQSGPTPVQIARLANLRDVWQSRFGGNINALARAIEKDRNQVRVTLHPDKPGGRWIGEELAREIEAALKLPHLSLDSDQPISVMSDTNVLFLPTLSRQGVRSEGDFHTPRRYPLIEWDQIQMHKETAQDLRANDGITYECPRDLGARGFVVRATGESMTAPSGPYSFPPGMLLFVTPNASAAPGQFVVATWRGETLFRRLVHVDGVPHLEALNPAWPNRYIPIGEAGQIIGVVAHAGFDLP